jgi:hypothetical protein
MPTLEVHQFSGTEIYRDIIRVNETHRIDKRKKRIKEGRVCLVRANGRKCFAVLRGYQDNTAPQIRMDDYTRGADKLNLKCGQSYEFEFKKVGLIGEWRWAWRASEMGYRVASRIAIIGLVMGLAGLFIGIDWHRLNHRQSQIANAPTSTNSTVTALLGASGNLNGKCVGHAQHLCGPERDTLPTEIAGVFATEPACQGIRLRGLTEQERQTPSNQLPLLLDVFYEGTTHAKPYMGTGKDESEGWMFMFNGPQGHFAANAHTESEMVSRVCKAAKGQGAEIDNSVGYTKDVSPK